MQAILAALRRRVEVRRVLVKPLFSDYEQQVNSAKVVDHITRSQMVQALSRLHVELTAEDAALLFERYDTLNDGTVNYIALVRDIDPYEAFSSRNVTQHTFPHDPDYGKVSYGKNTQGWTKAHVNDGLPYQPGRPLSQTTALASSPRHRRPHSSSCSTGCAPTPHADASALKTCSATLTATAMGPSPWGSSRWRST